MNILPGVVNEVVIEVGKLAPQWNTKERWFTDPANPNDFNVVVSPDSLAEGGDVDFLPGETPDVCYEIHTFTANNTAYGSQAAHTLTFKNGEHPATAEVLVVAGGGAGGYIYVKEYPIGGESDLAIPVKVGAGGAKQTNVADGGNGGASEFGNDIKANGGGGGAKHGANNASSGQSGGSGGGGSLNSGSNAILGMVPPGADNLNLGNKGGGGGNKMFSGGAGGGAGDQGGSATATYSGALGGVGSQSGISGTLRWYAGGGAGGAQVSAPLDADPPAEAYGATGGNDGDSGTGDGGSGGGGTTSPGGGYSGGNGGSGIVIVRFKRTMEKKKLDVYFNLGKFKPLMLADVKTESSSSLKLSLAAEPAVRLWPRYIADYFDPVAFSQNTEHPYIGKPEPEMPPSYVVKHLDDKFADIALYSPLFFTSAGSLPQRDVDALLEFELKYHTFGVAASGGRVWIIKNGLYNTPDDGGGSAGSYIPVKFGAGTPPDKKDEGTVIYTK